MTRACEKAIGLAMAVSLILTSAPPAAHAALPLHRACEASRHAAASDAAALACLSQSRRIELLDEPAVPAPVVPLERRRQLHTALHRWQAMEAEALATPSPEGAKSLLAYLDGRAIESQRSQALKDTEQAIARGQARIILLGTELTSATRAATQWIQRQPGRGPPAAYLQRIVAAADAILAEDSHLRARSEERDNVNRVFDDELERVRG